jgi:Uma2 family endonuclease
MTMARSPSPLGQQNLRYLRPVQPLRFPANEPEDEKVPESPLHLKLRTFLYQLLDFALGPEHSVGSEQFIYWNARSPRRQCAPDAFVKLGVRSSLAPSWKTWELGAPELVVEITSPSDAERYTWEQKLERFHELGVREVVRFDREAAPGARVRVWDRIEDDLVERLVENDATPCLTLGMFWVVASAADLAVALRLARDIEGRDLVLSETEAAAKRIAELEDELRRRAT